MILTPGVLLYHASYTAVENIDLSLCADETAVRLLLPNKLANQLCFKSAKSLTSLVFKESREVWINEGKQI